MPRQSWFGAGPNLAHIPDVGYPSKWYLHNNVGNDIEYG